MLKFHKGRRKPRVVRMREKRREAESGTSDVMGWSPHWLLHHLESQRRSRQTTWTPSLDHVWDREEVGFICRLPSYDPIILDLPARDPETPSGPLHQGALS